MQVGNTCSDWLGLGLNKPRVLEDCVYTWTRVKRVETRVLRNCVQHVAKGYAWRKRARVKLDTCS